MKLILLLVLVLQMTLNLCFVLESSDRPHYIECQSNEECGSVACCVIGSSRFSLPQCKLLPEVGEPCAFISYEPINTTVIYPDGAEVKMMNVHRMLCPCAAGLMCGPGLVCYDPILLNNLNAIDSNNDYH